MNFSLASDGYFFQDLLFIVSDLYLYPLLIFGIIMLYVLVLRIYNQSKLKYDLSMAAYNDDNVFFSFSKVR